MANNSIKAAFERLWQHVVTQLGTKADKSDVNTLNTLVGDTAVSTQINNAVGKITPSSIGALPTSGGSVSGNVDMTGTLTVNGIKLSGYDSLGNNTTADKVLMVRSEDDHYVAYITPENICKQGITGGISSVVTDNFNKDRALISNSSGKIASSPVTSTELGYLDGVTSSIQTQLNGKAASEHTHNALNISIRGDGATSNIYDGSAEVSIDVCSPYHSHSLSKNEITGILPVSKGGTGADDRIEAINNLISLPYNTEPTADTPAEWAKLGSFICYYSSDSTVINKPTTYGTLIQTVAPGTDGKLSATTVQQTWMRQGYGYVWTRAGNATGWNGSSTVSGADAWRRLYDSTTVIPLSNGGTGSETGLAGAPDNAMIRKAAGEDYLNYTATGNGAFYATAANGTPKFGTLPVAQGGTGSTSATTSVTVSAGSYAQNSSELFGGVCKYVPYLGMCFLRLYVQPNATLNADTDYAVATISNSTYQPAAMTALAVHSQKEVAAYINSEGKIIVRPYESITTSYAIRISGFWFV